MITGYQTLEDRGDPEYVEKYGPFRCEQENAWLGHGYYFWDRIIDWAHQWGENAYKKRKRKDYIICSADIEDDQTVMWDLYGNPEHQREFITVMEELEQSGHWENADEIVARDVINFLVSKGFFTFKSIRAGDDWNRIRIVSFKRPVEKGPKGQMTIGQRIQVCVLEKSSLTLQNFKIIYPEKYALRK